MYKMYGIPNCDTVKKAKAFLDAKGIEYEFINFKKQAPTKKNIKLWKEFLGELPVNKRGTTFRKFKDEFEAATAPSKLELLLDNSSAIKRPILERNDQVVHVGFKAEEW